MAGALHISGGVFALALLITLGGTSILHAAHRLRHPEWRTDEWWGNRGVARLALVQVVGSRRNPQAERTMQRTTDVVRALEAMALGTIVLMFAVVISATAIS